MYALLMQDWVTIRGDSPPVTAAPITQSERAWLDMSSFLDLVTFVEVTEFSGGVLGLGFQTSPTKDEVLFQSMNDTAVALIQGVNVGVYLRDLALCPLSQWLRWQLIPPANVKWDITFRIWVSANAPGGIARGQDAFRDAGEGTAGGPGWTYSGVPGAPAHPLGSKAGTQSLQKAKVAQSSGGMGSSQKTGVANNPFAPAPGIGTLTRNTSLPTKPPK